MKKSALILFLILSFKLLVTPSIHAQERLPLTVAPARQQINLDPGQSTTLVTRFFNEGTSPIAGNFKIVDFIVTDKEGTPQLLTGGELGNRFSGATWVTLSKDKAMIGPGAVEKLQYTLKIPQNAAPGGRYVAVYFEASGSLTPETAENLNSAAVAVIPRIVSLLYIRVNGPVAEMAFVKTLTTPAFVEYGPISISAEIANKGDYHITPKGKVSLFNLFGREIDQLALAEQNVFPGTSRVFETSLGGRYLLGKYKVRLAASYGDTGKVMTFENSFWAFPVRLVLLIILTTTLVVVMAIYIWKKLKQRQNKLEEKLKEELSAVEELKEKYKDAVKT